MKKKSPPKRSNSEIIADKPILTFSNDVAKPIRSIKPIEFKNNDGSQERSYYPKRRDYSYNLGSIAFKPHVEYDENLTFENAIDQIFEGLNQAEINDIKNHNKWNRNVADAGLPREKCLKSLQILAAIIKKKKANNLDNTKEVQEALKSNIQDFLNDSGCYANLAARLESYQITGLKNLVMSNALYQYIAKSGDNLTHFHDNPWLYATSTLKIISKRYN